MEKGVAAVQGGVAAVLLRAADVRVGVAAVWVALAGWCGAVALRFREVDDGGFAGGGAGEG